MIHDLEKIAQSLLEKGFKVQFDAENPTSLTVEKPAYTFYSQGTSEEYTIHFYCHVSVCAPGISGSLPTAEAVVDKYNQFSDWLRNNLSHIKIIHGKVF